MIFQFDPHSDELLYSVLARYNVASRNFKISNKETVNDAFSSRSASAIVDLPCRLNMLYLNLPKGTRYTPERIIRDHTLFPLFRPFLPEDRAQKAIEKMKGSGGDVHTTIGIVSSAIPMLRFMRYCPTCFNEDRLQYGESYWHRNHQVFGVAGCHKHQKKLLDSSLQISEKVNKQYFCDITDALFENEEEIVWIPSEHDLFIANAVEWLLQNEPPILGLQEIRKKYIIALQNQGYANFNGKVRTEKLIRNFVGFYGADYLKSVSSFVDMEIQGNWLFKLVRNPRSAMHPIRHLLLMHFLDQTPENFFMENEEYIPFGIGPWPCLNAAANHYGQNVIDDLHLSRGYVSRDPIGRFSCSCGFVYSRRGPDENEQDQFKIGKIKKYGHVWEAKLTELKNQGEMTSSEMATILGCNKSTLARHVKKLSQEASETFTEEGESHINKEKSERRKAWLDLRMRYPDSTRAFLTSTAPALLSWFYRNDRDWLFLHMPAPTTRQKYSDTRVDWEKRDKEILLDVERVVQLELQGNKKPERLAISMIGKRTGSLSILQKRPEKIPQTMAYINSIFESIDDFQVRRVKYAAQVLRSNSEILMVWRLVRKAGLRPGYSMRVHAQIVEECSAE